MTMAPKYEKKTLHESILLRPDSYVGQVKPELCDTWVHEGSCFVKKRLLVCPALNKVFDEILVNALDQSSLNKEVTKISIDVDGDVVSITNNGVSVPVVIHDETKVWTPELIFGHLLTSSNYDDSVERTTGGRNGYGAKLTNIYSTTFSIDNRDPVNKKRYIQVWENNMYKTNSPKISDYSGKDSSISIKWKPDWERFGMQNNKSDAIELFKKRAYDAAAWVNKCKVYYNGDSLSVKNFPTYCGFYDSSPKVSIKNDRWEVVLGSSNGSGFKQISFVNGICTDKGGTHIDHVVGLITSEIAKKSKLRPSQIKQCMSIFVKCVLVNPSFSSQSKQECTLRVQDFGSKFDLTPSFMKQVMGVLEDELAAQTKASEIRDLKKTDGTKKNRLTGIPKLDDANWAGTSKSDRCTLIITEGDSAKALAISGLSVVGRDMYGVFPLKGKPRNVRDLGAKALTNNQEFSDLKKILGLQQGKKYSNLNELRYGRLMIMTDADVDGSHIKGLVLNIFDCYWPELLSMGFLVSMITPVIKVKTGSSHKSFFTEKEYGEWVESRGGLPRGSVVKYYKGLGTSTSSEAKEYFKDLERLTVKFVDDEESNKSINLAFNKSKSDERKTWLSKPFSGQGIPYGSVNNLSVSDFIHKDLIQFSHADVRRSIPDLRDGLKPSQRKVIYGCMKRNLTGEIKVAQLSGYISEHTSYHHGEMSLQGTIVGLAQDFMGSNNMNLLEPCGQFGTRLCGGSDHASARYIFTKLSKYAKVFDARDSPCLNYLTDDGKTIEPEYYIPTLPMILVNGADGIGTGFSCKVPPHNPDDIRKNIKLYLKGRPMVPLRPWFRGFKGTVSSTSEGVWTLTGVFNRVRNTVEVVELPPGSWTQTYKDFLDEMIDKGMIKSYSNHSTEEDVKFIINGYEGNDPAKDLRLTTSFRSTNMYLHGPDGIKKYESTLDILKVYADERLNLYGSRKEHLIKVLDREAMIARNRSEFVRSILDGSLKVMGLKKGDAEVNMEKLFERVDGTYEYLWSLKTSRYTEESVRELMEDSEKSLAELKNVKMTNIKDMWLYDIAS